MRKIVQTRPSFFVNTTCDQKIVAEYRAKYGSIDRFLDENPEILDAVHADLRKVGSRRGRGAIFSSEQALRMCIVMCVEQLPYRETIIRVSESDFLRNFTRIGMGKVMSFASLCIAFKSISESSWRKINDYVRASAVKEKQISPDRLRLDSTVCETNIHYPTDSSLLWDTYRVVARTIRQCNAEAPEWNRGNRFHEKKIKRMYTYISTHGGKKNKSTIRKVKQGMKTLVERVSVLCDTAGCYVENARHVPCRSLIAPVLLDEVAHYQKLGCQVVWQAYHSQVLGEKVAASDRVFSIFEEHTELLKRGKARKPIEFGHMVTIGQTAEKFISFYDVRQESLHDMKLKDIALEAHKDSFDTYPQAFTADKNYYAGMDDIETWEEHVDCMAVGKKGKRSAEETVREHSDLFRDLQRFRAGIEGTISVLKRAFGLRRCLFRDFRGFAVSVGCLVFCHNLVLLSRL